MTRSHSPTRPATGTCEQDSPQRQSQVRGLEGAGSTVAAAEQGARWEGPAEEGDAKGSVQVASAGALLKDGLRTDGSLSGQVSGETEDGLSFAGAMDLGGGLFARARAQATDDPESVLVVVTVGASASFGLSAQGGQDSASLGFEGSIGGEATSTTARVVPRTVAGGLVDAWQSGDAGPWFDTFASLAAIGRFGSEAGDVFVSDLAPGEFHRQTSAVDARLCLPAAWRGVSVSAGASHHGERAASAEALDDGIVVVEVSFDTSVTWEADGTVLVGEVALGVGGSDTDRGGLTVCFAFDQDSEAHVAERVLGAPSALALEGMAAEMPWAVTSREVRTGRETSVRPHAAAPGMHLATQHTSAYGEAVSNGVDGLDASFEGKAGSGFDASAGGRTVLGAGRESSFSGKLEDGALSAELAIATSETAPGAPRLGVTPGAFWPVALRVAFVHSSEALFALDLSEEDIQEMVLVRPMNQQAWDLCGLQAGIAGWVAWRYVGRTLREADPPEEWVEAAGFRVAKLAMGMRELAVYASSFTRSGDVFLELTQRFGVSSGQEGFEGLGTVASWPPGTEDLERRFESVLARKETFAEDLAAAGDDVDAARELHHAIALPLNALTVAVPAIETDDPRWQPMMLEHLADLRVEVEWEYALFQRRNGECDESESDLAAGIADAEDREAFVLLGTMRSYQALEQSLFDDYRDCPHGITEFQVSTRVLYDAWGDAFARLETAAPSVVPDWQQYEDVLVTMATPDTAAEARSIMEEARSRWPK